MTKVWKGIAEIWGLAKNTAGDSVKSKMSSRNTGFRSYSWSGIRQNLSTGAVLGKGNSIRDRDDRGSGSDGIVVEQTREYEVIMIPIPDPAILIVCDTSLFLITDLSKTCPNDWSP